MNFIKALLYVKNYDKMRQEFDAHVCESELSIAKKEEAANNHIAQLNETISSLTGIISNLTDNKNIIEERINDSKRELGILDGIGEMISIGGNFTPVNGNSDELTIELNKAEKEIAEMISKKTYYTIVTAFACDGSSAKGERLQTSFAKSNLIEFTNYFTAKEKAVTFENYSKTVELLRSKYETIDKRSEVFGIKMSKKFLNAHIKALELFLSLKSAKATEKKKLAEEKKRLREEERAIKEMEEAKKKAVAERKAMELALNKALTDEEIETIKKNLAEVDERIKDIEYRATHTKVGYVYIISSPSLEGLVKIGTTRRLNPHLRVKELSSSSLPYPFKLHVYAFCEDCFGTEARMHEHFNNVRVVENREFFTCSVEEATEYLKSIEKEVRYAYDDLDDDTDTVEEDQ